MKFLTQSIPKSKRELRKFGFVMTVPLALLSGYSWWKGSGAFPYLVGAAGFFLTSALLMPVILRPVEVVWMRLADVMGAVMSRVILTLAFIFLITPLGLLLRLMGKDLLDTRTDNNRDSYWHKIESDGPSSRPTKPY